MYDSHFYSFLPFASIVSIIYGSVYGNTLFFKLIKKIHTWYYASHFFAKK
jgi:hypothetical protein